MEKLPYLLFCSPPIGPIALEALNLAKYPPVAVVDDPKLSLENQISVVEKHKPTFILVVGYGAILKRDLLDTVAGQVLNIHPSYLPAYRGPAPVVQAILDGAKETGVTLMQIDTQMDHGPIIAQEKIPLYGRETPEELYQILTKEGVNLFLDNIEAYLKEEVELLPQNDFEATFTRFIKKEEGQLDPTLPAEELERKIRAFHLWPRSWIIFRNKRLIIEKAHLENHKLRLDLVQPENGKIMTVKEYCAGLRISPESLYQEIGLF